MKLIVGLGNPGEKYAKNRHNAGFVVVSTLAFKLEMDKWEVDNKANSLISKNSTLVLAKPSTFMNDSGHAVSQIANFYKIKSDDIYIIYDDLDIALGEYKIQHDKGPKVHNGLSSVRECLGVNNFWHVRIGVENRPVKGNAGIPGVEYSLQNFTVEEKVVFDTVVSKIVDELFSVVS
ncbi:MAG: aminoacyl-tRNA hydrolase [bacterium]